jgi:hypothetical protein
VSNRRETRAINFRAEGKGSPQLQLYCYLNIWNISGPACTKNFLRKNLEACLLCRMEHLETDMLEDTIKDGGTRHSCIGVK